MTLMFPLYKPLAGVRTIFTPHLSSSVATTMDTADLKTQLNNCRGPQYTKIADLRHGLPYRIVRLDKAVTRFGETISATLEGLVGDNFFLMIYLPQRFLKALSDSAIESYNYGETGRLSILHRGGTSGIKFV